MELEVWKNVAIMIIDSLVTTVAHLIQIALWAVALLLYGDISTFETTFDYSAEDYTALGYSNIILSECWRLLGPIEAIDGLLYSDYQHHPVGALAGAAAGGRR